MSKVNKKNCYDSLVVLLVIRLLAEKSLIKNGNEATRILKVRLQFILSKRFKPFWTMKEAQINYSMTILCK